MSAILPDRLISWENKGETACVISDDTGRNCYIFIYCQRWKMVLYWHHRCFRDSSRHPCQTNNKALKKKKKLLQYFNPNSNKAVFLPKPR